MITKESLETAYCFLHQKQRVYQFSTLDWQRDDIEVAISDYVTAMPAELYAWLSAGCDDFLLDHRNFGQHMQQAVDKLEARLFEQGV